MILLAGLGNPGPEHAGQRHNIGFMAADRIQAAHGFGPWKRRFRAETAEGRMVLPAGGEEKILLLKPQTFMNLSGESVGEALRFFKLPPERVTVLYDELDLPFGTVRCKRGGGNAGHNGLKSLDAHITPDYWRVRLGIGHPGDRARVTGWVLGDFAKADQPFLAAWLDLVARHAPHLAAGDPPNFQRLVTEDSKGVARL